MKHDYVITAAGRINIIGEYVDFCGGKVFPAALSLCNKVYIRPNGTDKINLSWTTLPQTVSLDINKLDSYRGLCYGNYQAGSALMWQRAGHKVVGCDMLQECNIPFGSGLSSSAAIEVSTIAALATAAGEKFDPVEVALCAQKAEREYAGVQCGIMDQYASACGRKNHAMLLDCKTLDCEYLSLNLGEYSLVIADSNVPHNLKVSKYNERRAETDAVLELLKTKLDIECLADVSAADFEKYETILPEIMRKRARHVVEECARVSDAAAAMKSGDTRRLGRLLNASHESLRKLYDVTGDALDALADAAVRHDACAGSRMTGGGFGGCTISLVEKSGVADFKNYVKKAYSDMTGMAPDFYDATIEDGLTVTKL